jgi:hypothetical protein
MTTKDRIPSDVLALIRAVAENIPEEEKRTLLRQAEQAKVIKEIPGRILDVSVPETATPVETITDGPVRPIPALQDESGRIVGELIIWMTSGYLVGVERPWFTDVPPQEWPEVSALDFE